MMRSFVACVSVLAFAACCLALSEQEIEFLRDTPRNNLCKNIDLACANGCSGVKCTSDNQHILEIRWPNENVAALLPVFAHFHHIEVLDLSDNALTALPQKLAFPDSLRELRLAGNSIKTLPSLNLQSATLLDISRNQIEDLPNISAEMLADINMSSNYIAYLPDRFGPKHLPSLRTIELQDNCFDCDQVAEVLTGLNVPCDPELQERCFSYSSGASSQYTSSSSPFGSSSIPVQSSSEPNPHPHPHPHYSSVVISSSSRSKGLSGVAKAGIICLVIAVVVAIIIILVALYKKHQQKRRVSYQTVADPLLGDEEKHEDL